MARCQGGTIAKARKTARWYDGSKRKKVAHIAVARTKKSVESPALVSGHQSVHYNKNALRRTNVKISKSHLRNDAIFCFKCIAKTVQVIDNKKLIKFCEHLC